MDNSVEQDTIKNNGHKQNSCNVPELRFPEFEGEWEEKKLIDVCRINPKTNIPEQFNYIDLESVNSGILTNTQQIEKEHAPSRAQRKLDENDILFATVRPYQQNNYYFNLDGEYVASTGYAQIRAKENSGYLYYYIHTQQFLNEVLKRCTGTSYPAINSNDLKTIKIQIPTLNEQQKISSLFSTIDMKLTFLEKKYHLVQDTKSFLLKNLFSDLKLNDPTIRFGEFNEEQEIHSLKEILKESEIKGKDNLEKRLSVKLHLQGVHKRDIKSVEKEGATTQYVRKKGQFIYGKQNLHNGAFGIIPDYLDNFLSSSDIPSFDFISNINKLWFLYYLSNYDTYSRLEVYSTGTGSKRISPKTFLNLKIKMPSKKEQDKIAELIYNIDKKILNIEEEIEIQKKFKSSLLSKMFC